MEKRARQIFKFIFALYMLLVAFLCFWHFGSLPGISSTVFGLPADKIVHFLMFLPFPILAYLAFWKQSSNISESVLLSVVIFTIGGIIAAGTEIIQSFLYFRSADINDFKADISGDLLGSVAVLIIDLLTLKKNVKENRPAARRQRQ